MCYVPSVMQEADETPERESPNPCPLTVQGGEEDRERQSNTRASKCKSATLLGSVGPLDGISRIIEGEIGGCSLIWTGSQRRGCLGSDLKEEWVLTQ